MVIRREIDNITLPIGYREVELSADDDVPSNYDPKEWGRASSAHPAWLKYLAVGLFVGVALLLWLNFGTDSGTKPSSAQGHPTETNSPSALYKKNEILQVHPQQLIDDYFSDEEQANLKYKGKIVSVQGVIAKPPKPLDERCSSFSYGEISSCKGGVGLVESVDTDRGPKGNNNVVIVDWASNDDYLKGLRLHQYEAVTVKCQINDPDPMELFREENIVKQRMLANGVTPDADDFTFHTILLSNCTL